MELPVAEVQEQEERKGGAGQDRTCRGRRGGAAAAAAAHRCGCGAAPQAKHAILCDDLPHDTERAAPPTVLGLQPHLRPSPTAP